MNRELKWMIGVMLLVLVVVGVLLVTRRGGTAQTMSVTADWARSRAAAIFDDVQSVAVEGKLVTVAVGATVGAAGKVDWQETTRRFFWMACEVHQADASLAISLRAYHDDAVVVSADGNPTGLNNLKCEEGGTMRPLEVFSQYRVDPAALTG